MSKDILVSNTTTEQLKIVEHKNILKSSRMDRKWWGNLDVRFPGSEDRDRAVRLGRLVNVEIPNKYFTCPSDIRSDVNLQLLRPSAKKLLFQACQDLDNTIGYSRAGIRLAVTSLYRSDTLQDEIVNSSEWYRAARVGTSAHAAGAAFDISLRSHYLVDSAGQISGVNVWNDKLSLGYQPLIFESLGSILSSYANSGFCNLIVENFIEDDQCTPTCFHVCISPDVESV